MKKMRKPKFILLSAVLIVLALSLQLFSPTVFASETQVTFVLHKLLFENGRSPTIKNDGTTDPAKLLTDAQGLDGVTFAIYDVSEDYYSLRSKGKSQEETQQLLAQTSEKGNLLATKITATQQEGTGIAMFTVPAKDSHGRHAVYRFEETNAPEQVAEKAEPFVVVLPVYSLKQERLKTIHLYPKNEQADDVIPSLQKRIATDKKSFSYGDAIPFVISTTIPKNVASYDKYVIKDKADDHLWFDPDSLVIELDGKASDVFQIEKTDHGFTAMSSPNTIAAFVGKNLTIHYQMRLKGLSEKTSFDNEASLSLANHLAVKSDVEIQTGGKQFTKIDRKTGAPLSNAIFTIRRNDSYLAQIDGKNHWVPKDDVRITRFISGENGNFSVNGLAFGKYELVETNAPKGYARSKIPIVFNVEEHSYDLENPMPLQVINEREKSKGYNTSNSSGTSKNTNNSTKTGIAKYLPKTSEEATRIFLFIGLLLILLVGTVLIYKRQKRNNRRETK